MSSLFGGAKFESLAGMCFYESSVVGSWKATFCPTKTEFISCHRVTQRSRTKQIAKLSLTLKPHPSVRILSPASAELQHHGRHPTLNTAVTHDLLPRSP
jgi:hypothetical protein